MPKISARAGGGDAKLDPPRRSRRVRREGLPRGDNARRGSRGGALGRVDLHLLREQGRTHPRMRARGQQGRERRRPRGGPVRWLGPHQVDRRDRGLVPLHDRGSRGAGLPGRGMGGSVAQAGDSRHGRPPAGEDRGRRVGRPPGRPGRRRGRSGLDVDATARALGALLDGVVLEYVASGSPRLGPTSGDAPCCSSGRLAPARPRRQGDPSHHYQLCLASGRSRTGGRRRRRGRAGCSPSR